MRGDINTPWAQRAKEYSWSLCLKLAPRNITPTDIDYVAECKNKFAFFEMKTVGSQMEYGQHLMFKNLLLQMRASSILFVVEHTPLDKVAVPIDVVNFHCHMAPKSGDIKVSPKFVGAAFPIVYKGFFDWAEGDDTALHRAFAEARQHGEWLADYELEEKRQTARVSSGT